MSLTKQNPGRTPAALDVGCILPGAEINARGNLVVSRSLAELNDGRPVGSVVVYECHNAAHQSLETECKFLAERAERANRLADECGNLKAALTEAQRRVGELELAERRRGGK